MVEEEVDELEEEVAVDDPEELEEPVVVAAVVVVASDLCTIKFNEADKQRYLVPLTQQWSTRQ